MGNFFSLVLFITFMLCLSFGNFSLPQGFVYVQDIDPTIQVNLKYYSEDNFIGRIIPGYHANKAILTKEAAKALSLAQRQFLKLGYSILIYDCYRPQTAVDYFVKWMNDESDLLRKKYHYPYVTKEEMKGVYVATKSGHSKGSTVDITLIKTGKSIQKVSTKKVRVFDGKEYPLLDHGTIDCGSSFDLMDPLSHGNDPRLDVIDSEGGYNYKENRDLIKNVMTEAGFKVLEEEWWHFTLKNEPYPNNYFDFPVE